MILVTRVRRLPIHKVFRVRSTRKRIHICLLSSQRAFILYDIRYSKRNRFAADFSINQYLYVFTIIDIDIFIHICVSCAPQHGHFDHKNIISLRYTGVPSVLCVYIYLLIRRLSVRRWCLMRQNVQNNNLWCEAVKIIYVYACMIIYRPFSMI